MLSIFRNNPKLVVAIFALVALAFVATGVITHEMPGISGNGGGSSAGAVATIGDTSISPEELEQQVRNRYSQAAQQQPGLDMAGFLSSGAFDAIVDNSIGATAVEQYAGQIGLVASEKQINGQIAGIPAFRGADGKFNQQLYEAALQQQHLTDKAVRSDIAGTILRQMIYLPATGALTLPDGLVKPYASLLTETRAGEIGFVPITAAQGGTPPTGAELQAFYTSHIGAYTTPERRVLRYALMGRDQVAARAVPTDAEIKQIYDANPDKYAARETRDLSQVVLPDEAKAKAFKASVTGGKSFADAAKAAGFGAADIAAGVKTQNQFAQQAGTAVATAAFAVPQGAVTDPVKSDFGWVVVKVNAVSKVAATPFETARAQIAGDLVKTKQDKALADLIGKVQDALDNGQGFADIVKANGLAIVETPAVTAGGVAPDQPAYKAPAEVQPLLAPGFKTSSDDPASVQTVTQNERYALLAVGHVIPTAPIPFAQVQDRVKTDFLAFRANDAARKIATDIQTKVKAGISMADAFAKAPVKLDAPKPAQASQADLRNPNAPPPLRTLLRGRIGSADIVAAPGGWYVVQASKITPADDKIVAQVAQLSRNDLLQAANDEYLQQLSTAAKIAVGAKRDDGAIQGVRAKLLGATPAQ